jgi:hypothetical protein
LCGICWELGGFVCRYLVCIIWPNLVDGAEAICGWCDSDIHAAIGANGKIAVNAVADSVLEEVT